MKNNDFIITIRPERIYDHPAIYALNNLAFGSEREARLVERLRKSDVIIPELSLVAVAKGQVVGHILFSTLTIQMETGDKTVLNLAPLAVLPEFQNRGIGSELVRKGLDMCIILGHKVVVVVGHPEYYPRFGFSPAGEKGLRLPFEAPDEAFMALELAPVALDGVTGMILYPPEFFDE